MRHRWTQSLLVLAALAALASAGWAQSARVTVPARDLDFNPRDLSGVWTQHPTPAERPYASCCFAPPAQVTALLTPWGQEQFKKHRAGFGPDAVSTGRNDPTLNCWPPGVPRIYLHLFPMQIVQTPTEVLELFEYDHYVRHIRLGGAHPPDLTHDWMGDTIGHWEGNTLVVDTVALNDKTWLDRDGHPHSDQLHVIEHIRRVSHDTLRVDFTIIDPKAYTKTLTGGMTYELRPDWHIQEHICEDNRNDTDLEQ
jgi:hypothetical protein